MPNLGFKVSRVYPPWGGGVPAVLRELSGFWGRIKGIKEIRAGLRELTVYGAAMRFGELKTVFPKSFGELHIQIFRLRRCSKTA